MTNFIKKISIMFIASLVLIILAAPAKEAHAETARPIKVVRLSKTEATVNAGSSVGLTVTYAPANTTDPKVVNWKSSNSAVASVRSGLIKGNHAGKAVITAQMGDQTETCTVTVKEVKPVFVSTSECYSGLNKYRKHVHLKKVKRSAKLEKVAKARAKEIVTKFSHTRPNGKSGLTLIKGNRYKGENIAKGQTGCTQVTTAWYNSKGHRKNMLRKQFKKVGIAGYKYNGVVYWVQVFSS